jgi:hypothetical protein
MTDVDIETAVVGIKLKDVNSFLTCTQCKGYYRDAHTIPECLHTFCKVCIIKHFQHRAQTRVKGTTITCPKCETDMGGTVQQAMQKIIYDRNIQEIVDKMFPQFIEQEKEEKRQFDLRERQREEEEARQSDLQMQETIEASKLAQSKQPLKSGYHPPVSSSDTQGVDENAAKRVKIDIVKTDIEVLIKLTPYAGNETESARSETSVVNLSMQPPLPPLKKPTLKATLSVRISKIQKFIHKRFEESLQQELALEGIEILHNDVVLDPSGDLFSLQHEVTEEADQSNLFLGYRRRAIAE